MKLYQAGYFRLGGRGSGSGWKLVAPSPGMSEIAKAGFRGIAAKLVDARQTVQMPSEALGIFGHDRFIYFMHVNYAAAGEDSRGVAYVHGYCFNQAEYYELAIHPETLFGAMPEVFDMEYRPELSAYPVVQSLACRSMNERRLLDQYHISREQYKAMILGAICALEGYSGPLCIKAAKPPEQYVQMYRDVMYLIMKGLPYHLRQKLLSFSYYGVQTMVYVSQTLTGDAYIDLDTGETRCELSRLSRYQFTRLYNMELFYNSKETREQIFANIAEFVGEAFADPFKDAGCALIEAGFQKKLKKNDGGIEPEAVTALLAEFFRFALVYGTQTAGYLAALLESINQNEIRIRDAKLLAEIEASYYKCMEQLQTDTQLQEQMALFYAHRILEQKKEQGFAFLLKLKKEHAQDLYPSVCRDLEQMDARFFADYFWNQFLPGELTTLKKAELFLNKNGKELAAQEQRSLQKLLKVLIDREMEQGDSFEELCMTAEMIERMRWKAPYLDRDEQLLDYTYFMLWNRFDMDWFEVENVKTYKQYKVRELAQGFGRKECPNARKVSRLISLLEEVSSCRDVHRMWELLAGQSQNKPIDSRLMKKVQRGLRKELLEDTKGASSWILDVSLLLFYDMEKEQFDLVKWVSWWSRHRKTEEFRSLLAEYVKESELLAETGHRDRVVRSLEETLRSKRQTPYARLEEEQKKLLQTFYSALTTGTEQGKKQLFWYTLHREVLGFFALLALGMSEICLWRYGSGDTRYAGILAAVIGVCLLTALVVKAVTARDRAESFGVMAKCMYAGLLGLMAAAAGASYFLNGFLIKTGCMMLFLLLAAVLVMLNGLVTKK